MGDVLRPADADQLREAVLWSAAEAASLEITAGGSKRALGRPVQAMHRLDLSALAGVVAYEPEELILDLRPATPLVEVEALLADRGQMLAFEPPDLGPLLGAEAGLATIGGVVSSGLSGPRRIKAGAARDHLLGVHAVTGRGEAIKAGGRVVKNVTGYDLCKLFTGSCGTLGVLTNLVLKVLPAAEKTRTVLAFGLDPAPAAAALREALASPHEVSGAAHLPAAAAARSAVRYVRETGAAVTAVRVEGPPSSVAHRAQALRESLGALAPTEALHGHNSGVFWREVRDVAPLLPLEGRAVWRLSVPPAAGPAVAGALPAGAEWLCDWGGGLIWASVPEDEDAGAERIRATLTQGHATQGHATLVRASAPVRAAVPVFQPQPEPLAALTRRIKEGFDPRAILNPGRMYPGV